VNGVGPWHAKKEMFEHVELTELRVEAEFFPFDSFASFAVVIQLAFM
jgi:hypothetical protein